ncbi:hypothetical protein SAMN05428965_0165 [Geodermatophilus sp. DSM 45219]|nr:hypothetical protein SAMN05428965_0165 [Geodermatophilus sp. DSM 45219]
MTVGAYEAAECTCANYRLLSVGFTGVLLAVTPAAYSGALTEPPDLPRLCDPASFDTPEPLSPLALAAMDHHARRLGIDLVVRLG